MYGEQAQHRQCPGHVCMVNTARAVSTKGLTRTSELIFKIAPFMISVSLHKYLSPQSHVSLIATWQPAPPKPGMTEGESVHQPPLLCQHT